jgi:hypothetical protein
MACVKSSPPTCLVTSNRGSKWLVPRFVWRWHPWTPVCLSSFILASIRSSTVVARSPTTISSSLFTRTGIQTEELPLSVHWVPRTIRILRSTPIRIAPRARMCTCLLSQRRAIDLSCTVWHRGSRRGFRNIENNGSSTRQCKFWRLFFVRISGVRSPYLL